MKPAQQFSESYWRIAGHWFRREEPDVYDSLVRYVLGEMERRSTAEPKKPARRRRS